MFKCINGWTKEKMLEVANKRKFSTAATKMTVDKIKNGPMCTYLSPDGNKCAVGDYIPEGHLGQIFEGDAKHLLESYTDLKEFMPLDRDGLLQLQNSHDNEAVPHKQLHNGNATDAIIGWINRNVE